MLVNVLTKFSRHVPNMSISLFLFFLRNEKKKSTKLKDFTIAALSGHFFQKTLKPQVSNMVRTARQKSKTSASFTMQSPTREQ